MTALLQPNNLADLLRYEANSRYSREVATLASGNTLSLGTVIATDSVTGKIAPFDPDDTGSLNLPTGVLIDDCDAALADNPYALLVVRHAVVAHDALIWPVSITAEQQASAEAQLKTLGILVRDTV